MSVCIFILAIVLSVLLQFTDFGIFKHFLEIHKQEWKNAIYVFGSIQPNKDWLIGV
jgi:hypothetical protein